VRGGVEVDVMPTVMGRRPATQAGSLQPSRRRLARSPTAMTVKLNAAMKP